MSTTTQDKIISIETPIICSQGKLIAATILDEENGRFEESQEMYFQM